MEHNRRIGDAQVDAILNGDDDPFKVYVVKTLHQLIQCVEDTPTAIEKAVREQKAKCAGENKRAVYMLLAALGTCLGLATPYILALF